MSRRRFEARLKIGTTSYFMRAGTPREGQDALYVGPQRASDEIQHHLTLISDAVTGHIENIHLTRAKGANSEKRWEIIPEEIQSKIAKWIRDNSEPIGNSEVRGFARNCYCISAWRIVTAFRLVEGMMAIAGWVFLRLFMGSGILSIKEERSRNGTLRVVGDMNVAQLLIVIRKFRRLKPMLQRILPVLVTKAGPRLLRMCLTKPERVSRGDISLCIPKLTGHPAVVLVKWDQHLQVDAEKAVKHVTNLYNQMEFREIIPNFDKLPSKLHQPFEFDFRARISEEDYQRDSSPN